MRRITIENVRGTNLEVTRTALHPRDDRRFKIYESVINSRTTRAKSQRRFSLKRNLSHSVSGRGDFVGGIDNEALDFSQLEDFINSDSEQPAT